jgi:hypothetical protein
MSCACERASFETRGESGPRAKHVVRDRATSGFGRVGGLRREDLARKDVPAGMSIRSIGTALSVATNAHNALYVTAAVSASLRRPTRFPLPIRPPAQGGPSAGRRGSDQREWADPGSHPSGRLTEQRPERQRQPDRRRAVQPSPQDLGGHDQHAGAATLALVAPGLHRRHSRGALGGVGAPQLTLAGPVAVHDQIPAGRTARGPAARAPCRPNRRYRRHCRLPRLDADRTSANPIAAPHLACSELDAKGSAKIFLRVTFLSVADTASLRLQRRFLCHPCSARYPPFRGALVVIHPAARS